jgi:uracil-DNA glycosylase family protein
VTGATFQDLRAEAEHCRNCGLWEKATTVVMGEGPAPARLMLVGEQPGDQEDRAGRPFVGPAGRILDEAMEAAGVDRDGVFVTNAVKHFKWKPRGPRRIHDTPNRTEVVACRPWLDRELERVAPEVAVLMGATAGQSVYGPGFRLRAARGVDRVDSGIAAHVVATLHPSAVLRAPDRELRRASMDELISDLALARSLTGS